MNIERVELFNIELIEAKSNLRVIEITHAAGKKGKGERVNYKCIVCGYIDNITSNALRNNNKESKMKMCPVCQKFRIVTSWTVDKYISENQISIKRTSEIYSAKDKFNYECLECGYITEDMTYDRLKRENKSFCQCCNPTGSSKLTENLFDARVKYRCKPYKRIGNLIRNSKAKPSVMLHCEVCNTDFLSKDATYASISEYTQCPTCKRNNRILENDNKKLDHETYINNLSIKEKAEISYKVQQDKENKLHKYLESRGVKLISKFKSIYENATLKCIKCGSEKSYESLCTIYEVENLCKCNRYNEYENVNNIYANNEILENTNYMKYLNRNNNGKSKSLREDYEVDGIIYVATNKINGYKYVGQTIQTLEKRKYSHEWESINIKDNNRFHNAIRYYKPENFEWEIKDKAYSRNELDEKEKLWIEKLNTCISYENSKGYNTDIGGNSGSSSKGEDNPKAKLTNRDVENIKEEVLISDISVEALSIRYNVSVSTIYRILSGKSFNNIRPDLTQEIQNKRVIKPNYVEYWEMRYKKGMTDEEIAIYVGKTIKHVQTIISQANKKINNTQARKNKGEQQKQRNEIISLYKEGKSIEEIVELGYPKTTVKRNIDKIVN